MWLNLKIKIKIWIWILFLMVVDQLRGVEEVVGDHGQDLEGGGLHVHLHRSSSVRRGDKGNYAVYDKSAVFGPVLPLL